MCRVSLLKSSSGVSTKIIASSIGFFGERRHRREIYWAFERTIAFRHGDETAEQLKGLALSHIDHRIKDDELRAKLTPDYPFGCKRTLVCSNFYKAVVRDNVELVTDRQAKTPATAQTKRLVNLMRERGVLISRIGMHENILKIRPPMPFSKQHADLLVDTLDQVLAVL